MIAMLMLASIALSWLFALLGLIGVLMGDIPPPALLFIAAIIVVSLRCLETV